MVFEEDDKTFAGLENPYTNEEDSKGKENILKIVFLIVGFVGAFFTSTLIFYIATLPFLIDLIGSLVKKSPIKERLNLYSSQLNIFSDILKNSLLFAVSLLFLYQSSVSLVAGGKIPEGVSNFIVVFAIIGIAFNLYFLRQEGYKPDEVIKKITDNQFFGWVLALFVGVGSIFLNFINLDLFLTLFFSLFLIITTSKNFLYFAQGENFDHKDEEENEDKKPEIDFIEIKKEVLGLSNVVDVKFLKSWYDENGKIVITSKNIIQDTTSQENIYVVKVKTKKILKKFGADKSVVEIVYKSEQLVD
jgi:hypothetical protein